MEYVRICVSCGVDGFVVVVAQGKVLGEAGVRILLKICHFETYEK